MTRIDKATQRRITDSVRWTERQSSGDAGSVGFGTNRGGLPIRYAIASADIEHNAKGLAKLAKGDMSSAAVAFTAGDTEVKLVNPIHKVWSGALLLIVWGSYEKENETDNDRWSILQSWSATFIRGLPMADITPGGTGTLNTLVVENGTFTPTTASAYLPTNYVTAKAGKVAWAKLVYRTLTNTSRWEIYSADCDGV